MFGEGRPQVGGVSCRWPPPYKGTQRTNPVPHLQQRAHQLHRFWRRPRQRGGQVLGRLLPEDELAPVGQVAHT